MIPAGGDSVRAWVVYPERSTKAPVVVVVHEIFGLSTWVRAVADQLAAEGYIAIAPDFLTGKLGGRNPDEMPIDTAIALIRTLKPEEVQSRIDAAARYGMSLPAALPRYGVVGFCWGGSTVFAHAVHAPALGAAVVYYGGSPSSPELASVRAPVLGLYGGNDARVNATIPPADSAMRALGKTFEHHIFDGAGHGFLRAQEGQNGANLAASQQAWPLTIAWFRRNLGA
jgi:carboxymethylenebutenolidase